MSVGAQSGQSSSTLRIECIPVTRKTRHLIRIILFDPVAPSCVRSSRRRRSRVVRAVIARKNVSHHLRHEVRRHVVSVPARAGGRARRLA